MKYRKKPKEIEAIQWRYNPINAFENNFEEIKSFCPNAVLDHWRGLVIPTLEGNMTALNRDYIIKGIKGEFYPCKPDIFEATYEAVLDEER